MKESFRNFNWIAIGLGLWGAFSLAYMDAFAPKIFPPSEPDYLASLRDNSEMGCSSYRFRNPDILFMGDSHTYADWDFTLIEQALSPLRIGECAMGGLYAETAAELLANLPREVKPRAIVYGVSARQFMAGKSKQEQLTEHRNLLRSGSGWGRILHGKADLGRGWEILWRRLRGRPLDDWRNALDVQRNFNDQAARVLAIKDEDAKNLVRSVPNRSSEAWDEYLENGRFDEASLESARSICKEVSARGLKLLLVSMPESEELMKRYRPDQRAGYQAVQNELGKCGTWIGQPGKTANSGLNWIDFERMPYFVNRQFSPSFPYSLLGKPEELAKLPASTKNDLYDLDHMNPAGARAFSTALIPLLKASI